MCGHHLCVHDTIFLFLFFFHFSFFYSFYNMHLLVMYEQQQKKCMKEKKNHWKQLEIKKHTRNGIYKKWIIFIHEFFICCLLSSHPFIISIYFFQKKRLVKMIIIFEKKQKNKNQTIRIVFLLNFLKQKQRKKPFIHLIDPKKQNRELNFVFFTFFIDRTMNWNEFFLACLDI